MAGIILNDPGTVEWSGSVDSKGNRHYTSITMIQTDAIEDGPQVVLETPGLPIPGSVWAIKNDVDVWAFCLYEAEAKPVTVRESTTIWEVTNNYSTLPEFERPTDIPIGDPLLEPTRVEVEFVKYTEEQFFDKNGRMITNSAFELFKGQVTEFDKNRLAVTIEMNVPPIGINTLASYIDTVNIEPLWGQASRCIKLSNATYKRVFNGNAGTMYYKLKLHFDTSAYTFDKTVLDEGAKALNGRWGLPSDGALEGTWILKNIAGAPPDPKNPAHFIRVLDVLNNPMHVILNGAGIPVYKSQGYKASAVTIVNGGAGYVTGDIIVIAGGTSTETLRLEVLDVIAGVVTVVGILTAGIYTVVPSNPLSQSSTTGVGTSIQINATWVNSSQTTPGSIFIPYYKESDFLLLGVPTDIENPSAIPSPG